jgi:hypothetical protein
MHAAMTPGASRNRALSTARDCSRRWVSDVFAAGLRVPNLQDTPVGRGRALRPWRRWVLSGRIKKARIGVPDPGRTSACHVSSRQADGAYGNNRGQCFCVSNATVGVELVATRDISVSTARPW